MRMFSHSLPNERANIHTLIIFHKLFWVAVTRGRQRRWQKSEVNPSLPSFILSNIRKFHKMFLCHNAHTHTHAHFTDLMCIGIETYEIEESIEWRTQKHQIQQYFINCWSSFWTHHWKCVNFNFQLNTYLVPRHVKCSLLTNWIENNALLRLENFTVVTMTFVPKKLKFFE